MATFFAEMLSIFSKSDFDYGNRYFDNDNGQTLFLDGIVMGIMVDNGELRVSVLVYMYILNSFCLTLLQCAGRDQLVCLCKSEENDREFPKLGHHTFQNIAAPKCSFGNLSTLSRPNM